MYNHFIIVGHLTKDVEMKSVGATEIAEFCVASNKKFKDKEDVIFMDAVAFGKLAELCSQYIHKGSKVILSGRLRTETWEKDGKKNSRIKCIADDVRFLDAASPKSDTSTGDAVDSGEIPF